MRFISGLKKVAVPVALLVGGIAAASQAANYSSWYGQEPLVISPGTGVSTAVANFPLLVTLTSANPSIFNNTRADGFDIRFTTSDGATDLTFARQSFNKTTKTAEFWVLVPSIAANPNKTTIKLYYGSASATDVSNSAAVFSTAANYRAVWHMSSAAGANEVDATGAGHDLVPTSSPSSVTGSPVGAGNAKSFDGSSQYYVAKASGGTSSTLNFNAGGPLTISAWINPSSDATCQSILGKINTQTCSSWVGSYGWAYSGSTAGMLRFNDHEKGDASAGGIGFNRCYYNISSSNWTHVVWVRSGTGADLANSNVYINGTASGNTDAPNTSAGDRLDTLSFTIGADAPYNGGPTEYWTGSVQEVQVIAAALNASQVNLMYQSQNKSSNLIAFGPVGVHNQAGLTPASHLELGQRGSVIEYFVPKSAPVELSFIDIRGKAVLNLNRSEEVGSHVLQLSKTKLSAGTYIVRMKTSGLEKKITVNISK